jgi:ABC-2 type transport system permease protein
MRAHLIWVLFKRELSSYFATPIAYVFIIIFLFLTGIFTFYLGNFFARGQADLSSFFTFHPWLYLFLIPALAMRLWAEERKSGTIELLLTLPVTITEAVLGKFLAAWAFTAIALFLTFPMWISVNYLGNPDNAVILAGYIGSFLMAGAFFSHWSQHVRPHQKSSDCFYRYRGSLFSFYSQWLSIGFRLL